MSEGLGEPSPSRTAGGERSQAALGSSVDARRRGPILESSRVTWPTSARLSPARPSRSSTRLAVSSGAALQPRPALCCRVLTWADEPLDAASSGAARARRCPARARPRPGPPRSAARLERGRRAARTGGRPLWARPRDSMSHPGNGTPAADDHAALADMSVTGSSSTWTRKLPRGSRGSRRPRWARGSGPGAFG